MARSVQKLQGGGQMIDTVYLNTTQPTGTLSDYPDGQNLGSRSVRELDDFRNQLISDLTASL